MIPWIQVYSNLPTHRKTAKLADELKLSSSATSPKVIAAGLLVSLWTWAIQNAYDGDLSECSAETIAEACKWKKSPERLVQALKSAGFLDDNFKLHDWEEYSAMLIDKEDFKKAQTRERVREYRNRRRNAKSAGSNAECNAECNADVTVTHSVTCNAYGNAPVTVCNAPTIPYHTSTVPNQYTESSLFLSQERKKEKKKERNAEDDEIASIIRDAGFDPDELL